MKIFKHKAFTIIELVVIIFVIALTASFIGGSSFLSINTKTGLDMGISRVGRVLAESRSDMLLGKGLSSNGANLPIAQYLVTITNTKVSQYAMTGSSSGGNLIKEEDFIVVPQSTLSIFRVKDSRGVAQNITEIRVNISKNAINFEGCNPVAACSDESAQLELQLQQGQYKSALIFDRRVGSVTYSGSLNP